VSPKGISSPGGPGAPDDPDRPHDTDPLADTHASDEPSASSTPGASPAKRRAVHTGDVVGRYELIEEIGEGGMATVFRARDKELRREVAIKVLFPHLARRPEIVRRFHREARAAASLEHANILRVYDVGGAENDDPPYIVMELIRGHSLLAEIERRGPMLAEVAACVGALLADALAVAHGAGIIHRDVKPANVMIAAGGRLLLADFGVARLETEDSLVTKTGSVLGTPAYMSPEQASGDTAMAKSDLYSLGATIYQLATGSLPYSGSPAKVIAQIASGQLVPAVRRRAAVGPDLSRVIDRLMAADPSARPANAAEVAAELRAIASTGGLGDPIDELAAYFADPDQFVADRMGKVVSAVIAAAEQAIADAKPPRAMALADRASALAPQDPRVTTLVERVTEGGKASRRKRVLAIVGGAVVLAGGATVGAIKLLGGNGSGGANAGELARDAVAGEVARDALVGEVTSDAGNIAMTADATTLATSADAGAIAMIVDAGVTRVRVDAGVREVGLRGRDAAVAIPLDAAMAVDATPMIVTPDAAVASAGFLVVTNDTWCDVSIDGEPRGRAGSKPLRVDAGPHTVTCEQAGTSNTWLKRIDVAAGATVTVAGTMLGALAVTLEVDATIDGTPHPRGTVVRLKAGRHDLVIGGTKTFFDLRAACTVRSAPDPGCY
jgi:serine/threonine-protein kinase